MLRKESVGNYQENLIYSRLLASALALSLLACGAKKEEEENLPTPTSGGLILMTFQGVAPASALKNAAGKYLTTVSTISLTGYCGFGTEQIEVSIDTVVQATKATCGGDGSFTWSGSATADATHDLILNPVLASGSTLTPTPYLLSFISDLIVPTDPTFTFPATSPYEIFSTSVSITGTTSCDTKTVVSSSGGAISFTPASACPGTGTFSQSIIMNSGETRSISITAKDEAGNSSGAASTSITFGGGITKSLFFYSAVGSEGDMPGGGMGPPSGGGEIHLSNISHSSFGSANSVSGTSSGSSLTMGFVGIGIYGP